MTVYKHGFPAARPAVASTGPRQAPAISPEPAVERPEPCWPLAESETALCGGVPRWLEQMIERQSAESEPQEFAGLFWDDEE